MFDFFPYFVSGLMLAFACGAIYVRNPVYALLFLVAMVINMAFLFIAAKSEFLGLLLLIVYAGAVAVLFLFIVMMVNYKASLSAKRPISQGWPLVIGMVITLVFEVVRILFKYMNSLKEIPIHAYNPDFASIKSIGRIMYIEYANEIILTAVILLIGVIGSIIMTMKYVKIVPKRIFVSEQIKRQKENSVALVYPEVGSGIDY